MSGFVRADLLENRETVESGHHQVQNDQIRHGYVEARGNVAAVGEGGHGVALRLERVLKKRTGRKVVLYDQDLGLCFHSVLAVDASRAQIPLLVTSSIGGDSPNLHGSRC